MLSKPQKIALKRRKRAEKVKGQRQQLAEAKRAVQKKYAKVTALVSSGKLPKPEKSVIPVSVASQSPAEEQGISDVAPISVEI